MMVQGSISRANFISMLLLSWISILVLGAAWVYNDFREFSAEADRLRAKHFTVRKNIVKEQAERAALLVSEARAVGLRNLWQSLEFRGDRAVNLIRAVKAGLRDQVRAADVFRIVAKTFDAADNREFQSKVLPSEGMLFLLGPFPGEVGENSLKELVKSIREASAGKRQYSLEIAENGQVCTVLLEVIPMPDLGVTVISGACLESAEMRIKESVLRQLETIRYEGDGYIFAGTWDGLAVLGPARGTNVLDVTDVNGVRIVRELIQAAKRGGGYVRYVLPPFPGARSGEKVSYAVPVPDWNWYLGAGVFVDDVDALISRNRERLRYDVFMQLGMVGGGLLVLSLISLFISLRLASRMRDNINAFASAWEDASLQGEEIDPAFLNYSEFRELAQGANHVLRACGEAQDSGARAEERYAALVGCIPGIAFRCIPDREWTMILMGGMVLEITGYPAEDFLTRRRTYESVIHPDDREWVVRDIEEALKTNQTYTVEYRIVRADGSTRWLFERGQGTAVEEEGYTRLDGVILDVSDRKRAEDEYYSYLHFLETLERVDRNIRKADDLEAMLFETLETARKALGADRAWLLFPCDPTASTWSVPMERSASEFPGAMQTRDPLPMVPEVQDVVRSCLETDGPVIYDPETRRPLPAMSAEQFSIRSQIVMAVYPSVGEPWMFGLHQCRFERVWTAEDQRLFRQIARRLADGLSTLLSLRQLRESEERFRTFSEQTILGIGVLQDDRFTYVNKAFAEIFEDTPENIMGLPPGGYRQLVHPDDHDFVTRQALLKQEGENGAIQHYQWRALTRQGTVRWVEIHSRTAWIGGKPADLISLMDISERKIAEANLESEVARRTQELAEKAEELADANERLRDLDDLKTSVLTTVSHYLRTPLTSVLGFAKLARRDFDRYFGKLAGVKGTLSRKADRISSNLEVIENESVRLNRLVDDFVDLYNIEAGRIDWDEHVVSVRNLIDQALKGVMWRFEEKPEVAIFLDVAQDIPFVRVDSERLVRALEKLLDNAVKYTEAGTVTLRASETPQGRVRIEVEDTGMGIPEEVMKNLFSKFHHVELKDTMTESDKGTGLGLSIARHTVEHFGGKLTVASIRGRGSTFFVELPPAS